MLADYNYYLPLVDVRRLQKQRDLSVQVHSQYIMHTSQNEGLLASPRKRAAGCFNNSLILEN